MKYLFLLWQDESKAPAAGSPEQGAQYAAYGKFFDEASTAGAFVSGDPLQGSATGLTVSGSNGSASRTTGPFKSGAEQLVGFYVLECKDDDDAAAWAAKIPAAATGSVEVRPVMAM